MSATMPGTAMPAGFSIRAPRIVDAAEVAALVNVRSLADTNAATMSVSDLLISWEDPERNLEDEDWLVIASDRQIVAFMELYQYEPFTVFEFDCHVHPSFGGLGIEQVLLEIIEARARREMHRAP